MLIILEIEPPFAGAGAPIFVDEIGSRIDKSLGLRNLDAIEAVLDSQTLGEAESLAFGCDSRRRRDAGASLETLIEKTHELVQEDDRQKCVALRPLCQQTGGKFGWSCEAFHRNIGPAERRRARLDETFDNNSQEAERTFEFVKCGTVRKVR